MTSKSDTKFKEKLNCGFKYDMRNLVKFHHSKVLKFYFNGLFLSKVYEVSAKKNAEELSFVTLNSDAKFE